MNKDEKIKQLVDRFMAGETSLDEERALYRYFSAGNVAEELMPLREYFCSFASLSQDEASSSCHSPQIYSCSGFHRVILSPWQYALGGQITKLL